jgi:hypothetical protein
MVDLRDANSKATRISVWMISEKNTQDDIENWMQYEIGAKVRLRHDIYGDREDYRVRLQDVPETHDQRTPGVDLHRRLLSRRQTYGRVLRLRSKREHASLVPGDIGSAGRADGSIEAGATRLLFKDPPNCAFHRETRGDPGWCFADQRTTAGSAAGRMFWFTRKKF